MTDLSPASPDRRRGDLELEEAWRAAGADGYDTEFAWSDDMVRCDACGEVFTAEPPALVSATAVRDTASARDDLHVLTVRCPNCATAGRVVASGELAARAEATNDGERGAGADADDWRRDRETDRRILEHVDEPEGGGTLREQGSLVDAEGDDVREYTGEPVETDDGWVLPQQQNVGPGNEAGAGEWPDPDTPPAQTPPAPSPPARARARRNR